MRPSKAICPTAVGAGELSFPHEQVGAGAPRTWRCALFAAPPEVHRPAWAPACDCGREASVALRVRPSSRTVIGCLDGLLSML